MKDKNKIYLFVTTLFFLSVFFVRVDASSNIANASTAAECDTEYDRCYASYEDEAALIACDQTHSNCLMSATDGGNSQYEGTVPTDANGYTADTCVAPNTWENNECIAPGPAAGSGYTKDECNTDNGYWVESSKTCYTDKDSYCEDTMGLNYTWSTLQQKCTGDKSAGCIDDSNCAIGVSCIKGVCGGSATVPATAAEKADNNSNKLAASSASAAQQNAFNQHQTALANVASCGSDAVKCKAAQDAENAARQALLDANKAAEDAIAKYNASNAIVNPATASTGSGYMLCANGILATVCSGGGGTPYVAGISTGGSYGGGSYGGGFGGGSSSIAPPKCGTNFQDIGGVCFPTNTGLSNAPISAIVGNIFSWLMALFTTFAVIAFVVSGIQYFMSSGDESMAEKAKENATNAIIGIIVGLSGFIIIKAIAAALSGQSMFF